MTNQLYQKRFEIDKHCLFFFLYRWIKEKDLDCAQGHPSLLRCQREEGQHLEHRKAQRRGAVQTPKCNIFLGPFPKTGGFSAYASSFLSSTKEVGVQGKNEYSSWRLREGCVHMQFFFVFRTERETNLGWYILQTLASLCWLVSSLCSVTHVLHVTLFFPPHLSPTHTHLPHHQQPPSHQPTHLLSNGDQWMMEGCAMNMEQTQQTNSAMRCSTILT